MFHRLNSVAHIGFTLGYEIGQADTKGGLQLIHEAKIGDSNKSDVLFYSNIV